MQQSGSAAKASCQKSWSLSWGSSGVQALVTLSFSFYSYLLKDYRGRVKIFIYIRIFSGKNFRTKMPVKNLAQMFFIYNL